MGSKFQLLVEQLLVAVPKTWIFLNGENSWGSDNHVWLILLLFVGRLCCDVVCCAITFKE